MRWETYIRALVDRIFKLLPMREDEDAGINTFLDTYLADLSEELRGSLETFPELYNNPNYVMLVCTAHALRLHWMELPFSSYRRLILRMTNLLSRMLKEIVPE